MCACDVFASVAPHDTTPTKWLQQVLQLAAAYNNRDGGVCLASQQFLVLQAANHLLQVCGGAEPRLRGGFSRCGAAINLFAAFSDDGTECMHVLVRPGGHKSKHIST